MMPDPGVAGVPGDTAARYARRAAEHAAEERRCRARSDRIGRARILLFVVIVGAAVALARSPGGAAALAWGALLGASVAAFAMLVVRHGRVRDALLRHEQTRLYYEIGALRIRRDWNALPPTASAAPPGHPYAEDLDVVGHASLARLLDSAGTGRVNELLLSWLLAPPVDAGEIRARQESVRELVALDTLREDLGVLTRLAAPAGTRSIERLIAWCDLPPALLHRRVFVAAARALTAATIVLLLLQLATLLSTPLWMITATAGTILLAAGHRRVRDALPPSELRAAAFRHRVAMLARVEREAFESERLRELRARLRAGGGASRELARLARLIGWSEVRHSPMLHGVLQWLLQWDIHVGVRAERWRGEGGTHVRDWLSALDEIGALAALATLAAENPEWALPVFVDADAAGSVERAPGAVGPVVEARALAHPLIPAAIRVANDVVVGPPGSFLLVTGSNMSGKSTLLRAIGANVLLAQAGGPVCAASLRLPVLDVRTSIRVADSLEQGVSLFMAELRRLKEIVDAARARPAGRPLLYLLDEILHGTNTAERRIAARTVIGHLVDAGAIGVVTTHDLTLASDGPLREASRPVHFTEHFERVNGVVRMSFDYRLRPGLATSTNALALLELVGLGGGPAGG